MEILVAVELDDPETLKACLAFPSLIPIKPAFGGGDAPQTKPRALNAALRVATGDFIVVYDAEDQPHPGQLKEAIHRFALGGPSLGVLQAPLRIPLATATSEIERQFSIDYAALFEVTLPALARFGAPFPLGGSSNHFRRDALIAVGGWDPWNVTEDADVGFKLARLGYRSGLLTSPTYESAPRSIWPWVKQRSRWIKGHLQTLKVHTRDLSNLRPDVVASLLATLVANLASSAFIGPASLIFLTFSLRSATERRFPLVSAFDVFVFVCGWACAVLTMIVGCRRAGTRPSVWSLALAPLFWIAQSLAFVRAVRQLIVSPYLWDKTDHVPISETLSYGTLDEGPAFRLSGGRDWHAPRHIADPPRPRHRTVG